MKRHLIVGHRRVVFGPRVPWSSLSSSKSASGAGTVEVVLEPGLELLKLLDEWEVLELVDELLEGDTKCGRVFCIKKILDYHGRNQHVGLDIVIPVTNTLTV